MTVSRKYQAWVQKAHDKRIEEIARQRGIEVNGKVERKGPCPRCGGTDRFSINTSKQKWNCRGCECGGDVIELVKFLDGSEFAEAVEKLTGEPAPTPKKANGGEKGEKKLEETYDYRDEEGRLLFQALRYSFKNPGGTPVMTPEGKSAKTFLQRHRDPETGNWVWNVKGCRLVPYRLPELIKAIAGGQTIYVVEGEGKVDALRKAGLPATCNPMGAGKWPQEFVKYFAGADVVALPDNDRPGRDHAQAVAASLHSVANSVKVLMLPGLPIKGDIKEWFAAGHDVHEIIGLADDAPEYVRPADGAQLGDPGPTVSTDANAAENYGMSGPEGLRENPRRPFVFNPEPYDPPDPALIPKREWLYGRHYLRGIVSASLGAPGGLSR
jgi:hypothetical protein